ncbi:unnamed protein product [Nesidiocoris tenuis]|uniref:Uncharacterized protein n=1 Tax=Nesidiocoris tenuis TaxID=355587 RepID=A0A6H5HEG9_9HEMI|nr:unnamed protein product [Nesidiocoris tenuis]
MAWCRRYSDAGAGPSSTLPYIRLQGYHRLASSLVGKSPLLLRWDISCSDHQNQTAQTDIWKQALEILKAALSRMKCQYDNTHAKVEYNIDDILSILLT